MSEERILVIDDGAEMREFVIDYVLKPNDFQPLEARDGLEGLDAIEEHNPDLIILDLQMPRLDGIGLLRRMQEEQIDIPVVLMTFYGSEEIAIEVFRLGVKDYVIKPFTDDELLAAINKALVETRLKRERDSLKDRLIDLNKDLQRQLQDFQTVMGIGREIANQVEPARLAEHVLATAVTITKGQRAELFIMQNGQLYRDSHHDGGEQPSDTKTAYRAIEERRPVIGDLTIDHAAATTNVQACAPIIRNGRAVGVLSVTTASDHVNDHQLNLLAALADYIAVGTPAR